MIDRVSERLRGGSRLRPVVNATGILLHTGLGRAPLAAEAIDAVAGVARGYCNLELDLDQGERGRRTANVARLLERLSGAESAAVVNNNAAATVLTLRALAAGREVIVSRGQLVEIGGSYRLPEIIESAGVRLREVGTTNRTRLDDYERAIGADTAAILRVHTSNYRIVGFTGTVEIDALAALARSRGIACIDDIGSGALAAGLPPGVHGEPTLADAIRAGADAVLFSGDKLLGGPQCGVIAGRKLAIDRITAEPLMRAVRVDKMTLAALEATLQLALDPARGVERIPLWRLLATPMADLDRRAHALAASLRDACGLVADVIAESAYLGGGSAPDEAVPSVALRLRPPFGSSLLNEDELARALRTGEPAVVPRIRGGCVLLDLRAVREDEDGLILRALARLVGPRAVEES